MVREGTLGNTREQLAIMARGYPGATVAMEAGTHSPWVSRFLREAGVRVLVANPRKTRAIYKNQRKSDRRDAMMLARLARMDPTLLHPSSMAVRRPSRICSNSSCATAWCVPE
jgi:transposase